MGKRPTGRLDMINDEPCIIFACPTCGTENTFILKDNPKGSTYPCSCGEEMHIPLSKKEAIVHIAKYTAHVFRQKMMDIKPDTIH
jgi:transcription elongation factor Elf1